MLILILFSFSKLNWFNIYKTLETNWTRSFLGIEPLTDWVDIHWTVNFPLHDDDWMTSIGIKSLDSNWLTPMQIRSALQPDKLSFISCDTSWNSSPIYWFPDISGTSTFNCDYAPLDVRALIS